MQKTQSFYKSSIYQQKLEFCSKQYITKSFCKSAQEDQGSVHQMFLEIFKMQFKLPSVVKRHEYVFNEKNFNLIQENKDTSNTFLAFGLRIF